MADFLIEVQPHEREARNDKGLRRMPQPFSFGVSSLPAAHTARLAAVMASGAVSALYLSVVMAVQLDETLRRAQGLAQQRSNATQKSLFGIEFPILGTLC
jgi:hypothetical protein